MGLVERREELFEHLVRLRRAGRELPGSLDIAAVRASLERELGATVSQRLAARVLGVSHTSLQRWIASGDLTVVYSHAGRFEVPVAALLELREAVDASRARGEHRHPLAATVARQHEAARRVRAEDLDVGDRETGGHDRARARGLAYHRVVARRLDRSIVEDARTVLARWHGQGHINDQYAERWAEILDRPLPAIREAITDESVEGDELRQTSPLAGVLSEPERRRILEAVR